MEDLEEVERLIEEHRKAKSPRLDLSWCNLTGKEETLKKLKNLEHLTLINLCVNQISDISFLKELKQIQKIYLTKNQISDISFLKELKELRVIFLSENQISDISSLKELKELQVLYLSNNKITEISLDILNQISKLEELYLSDNPIKNIPKEILDKKGNVLQDLKEYLHLMKLKTELLKLIDEIEYSTFFVEAKKIANPNPELARLRKRFMHDGGGFEFAEQLKVWVLHNFE
jgi:Leucine-rich repeat (LRR) protein